MAFERLRTIVITAISEPRSRKRFRKIAETTPTLDSDPMRFCLLCVRAMGQFPIALHFKLTLPNDVLPFKTHRRDTRML
jgi:hypothetical protein